MCRHCQHHSFPLWYHDLGVEIFTAGADSRRRLARRSRGQDTIPGCGFTSDTPGSRPILAHAVRGYIIVLRTRNVLPNPRATPTRNERTLSSELLRWNFTASGIWLRRERETGRCGKRLLVGLVKEKKSDVWWKSNARNLREPIERDLSTFVFQPCSFFFFYED